MPISTVGHGARPIDVFGAILSDAGIERLIDIRRHPASRHHPQFNRRALERALAERGIAYESWADALGGRREPRPDSPHRAWAEPAFQGYADHLGTPAARAAVERLIAMAADERVAVCCSESDWHHCHRRLVADALVLRGEAVVHLGATPSAHELHPGARADDDGWPVYDVIADAELFPDT
jgi:uncharacterized protein (DUF488 family)